MTYKKRDYFLLFENCIVVRGARNSIICDLQRNNIINIDINQVKIINLLKEETIVNILNNISKNDEIYINGFIRFMVDNDLGFITDNPILFPKISLYWNSPFKITNAIIDVENFNYEIVTKSINELNDLRCPYIQIRYLEFINLEQVFYTLDLLENSRTQSIEIILRFKIEQIDFIDEIRRTIDKYTRITRIILYDANKQIEELYKNVLIIITPQLLTNIKACGQINKTEFGVNMANFTESISYNSCLNRKISINSTGDIKNCPSMTTSYGNILNISLNEVLNNPEFISYWNINKDKINICKDCEFRYVCTDCRAYLENPLDLYSKPLKCGYDPYTGTWSDWSTNPLKQQAISHYNILNS